jgi:AraC-like DNA-binding protein/photosystem II stability/assembly factor-like uncharacterized protein
MPQSSIRSPVAALEVASLSPHVRRMVELIEQRFAEHLCLEAMAQAIGRQAAYLGRLFQQQTGFTTRDYVARCRLNRAAGLIRQGDKVEAVALEVGYRSKKNFYRQFRHRFGMTPTEYRRRASQRQPVTLPDGPSLDAFMFRPIGPAVAGSTISAIAVAEGRPSTFYVAGALGGLWKTVNNGTTWQPIFGSESSTAIGALALAPSDPSVIWVGTGDADSVPLSWGDGVYRSTDAGQTWTHTRLRDARHVGRIVVHAQDPRIAYVASSGSRSKPGDARGLSKTSDGGETWSSVLVLGEDDGVTDLAAFPSAPDRLIAAVTRRRRSPASSKGHAAASGLYVTDDGGATWTKLGVGLPTSDIYGASLDICRRRPHVIYASLRGVDGGIFRSDDASQSWQRMSAPDPRAVCGSVHVDPDDPLRIYLLGEHFRISDDGGQTFRSDISRTGGSAHRVLWIDPADPHHLIDGGDDGVRVSYDRAHTWQSYRNLPIAQVCQVAVDLQRPYHVYAGLQKSGAWCGPSATRHAAGIANGEWVRIPGGGLVALPDPSDANTLYTQTRDRRLIRHDVRTAEQKMVSPALSDDSSLRAPATASAPLVISSFDSSTLYVGLDRVFKSTDRGVSWNPVGPDLTQVDPARRRRRSFGDDDTPCSNEPPPLITTLAESAKTPALLYVGTDDGRVFACWNQGRTWQDVSDRIDRAPQHAPINRLATACHEGETAYLAFDARCNDDFAPYLYMTTDAGHSWTSIASDLPAGPVHAICEDPRNQNLLYVGTETGLYVSFNRGARWMPLRNNLPVVQVSDIVVHPRDNDLLLATRGRGIWILDDATPLQQWGDGTLATDYLFAVRSGIQWLRDGDADWLGDAAYAAPNPPAGTFITYHLKEAVSGALKLVIRDTRGAVVRELEGPRDRGAHRVIWDLRLPPPHHLQASEDGAASSARARVGAFVLPGDYEVTLVAGGTVCGTRLARVEPDPGVTLSDAARELQQRALIELTAMQDAVAGAAAALHTVITHLQAAYSRLERSLVLPPSVLHAMAALARRTNALCKVVGAQAFAHDDASSVIPVTLRMRVNDLKSEIAGTSSAPTPLQTQALARLQTELSQLVGQANAILTHQLPAINRQLEHHGASPLRLATKGRLPPAAC